MSVKLDFCEALSEAGEKSLKLKVGKIESAAQYAQAQALIRSLNQSMLAYVTSQQKELTGRIDKVHTKAAPAASATVSFIKSKSNKTKIKQETDAKKPAKKRRADSSDTTETRVVHIPH